MALEGSTSLGDWLNNAAFSWFKGSKLWDQLNPLVDALQAQINNNGVTEIFVAGQSLGGGQVAMVIAKLLARGVNPNHIKLKGVAFSTPGWADQIRSKLVAEVGQTQADQIMAQINDPNGVVEVDNYIPLNDPIRLAGGTVIGGSTINGPEILREMVGTEGGVTTTRLYSNQTAHGASVISELFSNFYSDFSALSNPNNTVIIDKFNRPIVITQTLSADVTVTVGDLQTKTSQLAQFSGVNVPMDSKLVSFHTMSDGTAYLSFMDARGNTINIAQRLITENGVTSQVYSRSVYDPSGNRVGEVDIFQNGQKATTPEQEHAWFSKLKKSEFLSSELLATMGTALGSFVGGNTTTRILGSAAIGAIGLNIGQALDAKYAVAPSGATSNGAQTTKVAASEVWQNISVEFFNMMRDQVVGTVSSFLAMELGNALGVKGFGGELLNTVTGTVFGRVLYNVSHLSAPFTDINSLGAFKSWAAGNGANVSGNNWNPGAIYSAIGGFLGAKLGAAVVPPQTNAAVVFSTLGSAAGAWSFGVGWSHAGAIGGVAHSMATAITTALAKTIGQKAASALANVLVPGFGVFLGFVLGSLIGNLFGKKKKIRVPSATAETVLQVPYARYELGAVTQTNGGDLDLVTSMAASARNILNSLITQITDGVEPAYVSNLNGYATNQTYGHTNGSLYVRFNGATNYYNSVDDAVEYGSTMAIRNTKIVGGSLYLKRVISKGSYTAMSLMLGDMKIAEDYEYYLKHRGLVEAVIEESWDSLSDTDKQFYANNKTNILKYLARNEVAIDQGIQNFYNANQAQVDRILAAATPTQLAVSWIITLQRAAELNLDQWAVSDFYGGLRGFLDSAGVNRGSGVYYEQITTQWVPTGANGMLLTAPDAVFRMVPQAAADGKSVIIDDVTKVGVYASAGATSTNNDFIHLDINMDDLTATQVWVDHGYWQQTYYNGWEWEYEWVEDWQLETQYASGGDDIFIAGGSGNVLNGRDGWDWLDGQAGNDLIYGGSENDVLLGGSGDDTLYGEMGDDYSGGGDGNDNIASGDGNDILVGNAGYDNLWGEGGNDTLLADQDGGGTWDWFDGGAGSDTISYERFGVSNPGQTLWQGWPWAGTLIARSMSFDGISIALWDTQGSSDGRRYAYGDGLINIENVTGTQFNDYIWGDAGNNVLKGGAGNDFLDAHEGQDILEGGAGADFIVGISGGDMLSYEGSNAGVYVNLTTGEASGGDAEGDYFLGIQHLRGSKVADELKGDAGTNTIEGLDGDDWIVATAGGTQVYVDYDDYDYYNPYYGYYGNTIWTNGDVYNGGLGYDTVDYSEATGGITAYLGSYTSSGASGGSGSSGLAGGHSYISIEAIVGSAYADSLSAGASAHVFEGGKGNDSLQGGAGADTYILSRGDGQDTIYESNTDGNKVTFGPSIRWSDLTWGSVGGSNGYLYMGFRGTSDSISVYGNFATLKNNRMKVLDLNGASYLDFEHIDWIVSGATDSNDTLYGTNNKDDLLVGYYGNDTLWGYTPNQWSGNGNTFIGGFGNDTLYAATGDDQFAYDLGEGVDTIVDSGGEDTVAFGGTVAVQDVFFEVLGVDLYIGIKDAANPTQTASQVSSRIKVQGGGVQYLVHNIDYYYNEGWTNEYDTWQPANTIEYVLAGGSSIDVRKLDLNWTTQETWNYNYIYPIALDLDGDGLNLSTVDQSQILAQTDRGGLSRVAWVGPTDAFLAYDRDGDGAINRLSEISFAQDTAGAKSDLEGLTAWDTNKDGILDAKDENFGKLVIFQDLNQNGRSTQKELKTLAEAGISAIDLRGLATGYTADLGIESFIQHTFNFIRTDGTKIDAYDVALARRVLGSEGLYTSQFEAEWSSSNGDAVLGQLEE